MAHKKGGGTTRKNRDSAGKRLGVKIFGEQITKPGSILVRQRGTRFYAGLGTKLGRDHTIFAVKEGVVKFKQKLGKKFIDIV